MTITLNPASEKQTAFVRRLISERAEDEFLPAGDRTYHVPSLLEDIAEGHFSKRDASELIDRLLALPRPSLAHDDGNAVGEGYYMLPAGEVYQVVKAKSSGNLYAKRFTTAGYEYAPGVMRTLASAERLTLAHAARLGKATGRCVICARLLTAEESVLAGIGPVCAARL